MSTREALRSLTIALMLGVWLPPGRAFNVHHMDVTRMMERAAAAHTQPDSAPAASDISKHVAVLHITPDAATTNPIETTAKTEEIQKNTTEPTDRGKNTTTTYYETTTDSATETTNEDIFTSTEYVKSQSNSSVDQTESTSKITDDKSITTQKDNETSLNIKTKADNGTSYSTELVINETNSVEASTVREVDGTDSNNVTETTTATDSDNGTVTFIPYLKKYTIIDRKRLNEEYVTTTENDEDLINTAQSQISLEKAFSISSDIPSLEKLKSELLSFTSKIPTKSPEVTSETEAIAMLTAELSMQSNVTEATERTSLKPRVDTMSSMRGGFLDYSSRITANDGKTNAEDKELSGVDKASEINVTSTPVIQNNIELYKNFTAKASQSQLAEDAIKEELMKETMIRDVARDNATREKKLIITKDNVTREKNVIIARDNTTREKNVIEGGGEVRGETSTEDNLSVKPINAEKSKTATLYAVSPNYKPMKKIEVQPPKTFARDPDDNSWRNESLSSMGIVFKANNSTKPFTQVLKNKTETELNSLLDKYNDNREQELRERLEKISEKRKSKRKKVDKNGDVTYVDYEESNSGETTTKTGNTFKTPYIPPLHEVSPEPTPQLRQSIFSLNSSAFDLELNKTKQNNGKTNKKVIETFDGDDDDSEYISLPEIDIKKFMTPYKSKIAPRKGTIAPPLTTIPYFPERKPTLQYFPPLQKKKINVNEYDDSFRNKINSYTIKEPPPVRNHPTPFTTPLPKAGNFGLKTFTTGTTSPPRTALDMNKSVYLTNKGADDNGYNRGPYMIKHLKDFMEDAVKVDDDVSGYVPPVPVATRATTPKLTDYFDYDSNYRKNIIDRFVENFNAQNERFKVDFPVVYNSSVVHSKGPDSGMVPASSSAFMRRLFDDALAAKARLYQNKLDPNCDRTVELSPAYELHYYVPEDEEKQEAPLDQQRPAPFRYQRPQPPL